MAEAILAQPFKETGQIERDKVIWLFNGRSDLWSVAIPTIDDPDWFGFLADNHLWSKEDAAGVLAAWFARDFMDTRRFEIAIKWHNEKLSDALAIRFMNRDSEQEISDFWLRAWAFADQECSSAESRRWNAVL